MAYLELPDAEIAQRYLAGESELALSKCFGVSRSAIRARILAAGISPRGSTEANRAMSAARSPEEHQRNALAAHAAARGRIANDDELLRKALARERNHANVSPAEKLLGLWLDERGIATTPQKAVGPYNIDLAAEGLAIEVYGGGWHSYGRHAARSMKRAEYLTGNGWALMVVWVDGLRFPLAPAAADKIARFLAAVHRDPTLAGTWRAIRGDGVLIPTDGLSDLSAFPRATRRRHKRSDPTT